MNGTAPTVLARLRVTAPRDVRLCSIVKAELYYGACRSSRPAENLRALDRFFNAYASMPFDDVCAERYGRMRHELRRLGTPIGPNDLMIAAIAVTHGLTLVTHNVGEFSRVLDLKIEDWEA